MNTIYENPITILEEEMFAEINNKTILHELKSQLSEKFKDIIEDVILFGSKVSGAGDRDSDYDILVVLTVRPTWEDERVISDICYDVELKNSILIDAHIIGVEELSSPRGKQPVFINALSGGLHA